MCVWCENFVLFINQRALKKYHNIANNKSTFCVVCVIKSFTVTECVDS